MAEHFHGDEDNCPACIEETDAFTDGYAEGVAAERERCAKNMLTAPQLEALADFLVIHGDIDKNSVCLTAIMLREKAAAIRGGRRASQQRTAHSRSEFRRLTAQGVSVDPPTSDCEECSREEGWVYRLRAARDDRLPTGRPYAARAYVEVQRLQVRGGLPGACLVRSGRT